MCKLFMLLAVLAWSLHSGAQTVAVHKLAGVIKDSASGKGIPSATITLEHQDKLMATTATDTLGNFELQKLAAGKYTLKITSVGYRLLSLPVTINSNQPIHTIGVITLSLEKGTLGSVTVTSLKALVEDKGDRLVYNAEKDISNAGGTAADVLRKVPSLTVDLEGNVQMRGNGNIKVLINGKPSAMMARNLADALKQMPANVIKTVEVITSPGAKYDAEGSAGIINIITKKGLQGFNGSASASVGNFNRGLGTNLNFKKNKIGISLSANVYQYRNIRENAMVRTALQNDQPLNVLKQSSDADNTGTGGYGEMSFDYDPDSSSRINLAANVWGGNYPSNSTMYNVLTNPSGAELQSFRNESRFRNPYGNGQIDLGYTKTFKKPSQEFSLLGQFSRMPDNYFYETDNYTLDKLSFRQKSKNYSSNKEYTGQADYTHPVEIRGRKDTASIKIEVGTKIITRDIGSEYRVEQSIDGQSPYLPDPSQSNDFAYLQRVLSGYTSLRIETKRKWMLNVGGRIEQTNIEGKFITTSTTVDDSYHNIIPSVTLSKGFGKHNIKVSYTQRITRPLLWYLNPWLNKSDPKNIYTGNPDLDPELSHATELVHSYNSGKGTSLNTSLYWRRTSNAIEYLSTVDNEGISLSKPLNIATRQAYGLNINLSSQPVKNWNLNGGGDLRYIDLRSPALNQKNNGIVWSLNLNSTYKIGKKYSVQANGSVSSGWISLQGTNTGFYWYGFTGKRMLMKDKANINLQINNPFNRGVEQKRYQSAPSFTMESTGLFVNRSARLVFEWRFGQMSAGGKQTKKIQNDDAGGR